MKKRIVSLALALMMCLSLNVTAFATEAETETIILGNIETPVATEAISWGSWSSWTSDTIDYDLGVTAIAAYLQTKIKTEKATVCIAIAEEVVNSGSPCIISTRIRYGSDSTYYYYQRQTKITLATGRVFGPYSDEGKSKLDGSGGIKAV